MAQAVIEVLRNHSGVVSILCHRQLQKDATAVEIDDDWAPDYDIYDDNICDEWGCE